MVSRILISIALLCSSVAFSQDENGLTFSQVLLVEYDSNESLIEVPEGKVWKIVSAVVSPSGFNASFLINSNVCKLVINNSGSGGNGIDTYSPFQVFPMWLPEGTNLNLNNTVTALSVIEFNTD